MTIHEEDRREYVAERGTVYAPPVASEVVVPAQHMAPIGTEAVRVDRRRRFAPAGILEGLLAIGLLIFGGVAAAKAGFSGALDTPVVRVGPWHATAVLAIIALAAGLILLLCAFSSDSGPIATAAVLVGVAAVVGAIMPNAANNTLGLDRSFAILVAIVCGVILLAALLTPSVERQTVVEERAIRY